MADKPKSNIKYTCEYCGSTNISFDAWAKWDIAKQEFVLETTAGKEEYEYCNDCEQSTTAQQTEV